MEFIINPSLLKEELGLLTPVIERKASIPVLSKIKMETSASGELALTATDLDVTMRSLQVTDVLQTGSILVEGRKLYDISRELPNEPIHFQLNKTGQIEIRYKRGRHKLGTAQAEQFPEVPDQKQSGVRVPAVILREAIRRTAFAVTTEQSRFTIQGAKIVVDDRNLTMVATDGHRLAYTQFPLAGSTGQKLDLLVPKKTILKLEDLLDREIRRDAESQIEIGDGAGNQLCFAVGNHSLFSRRLSGTFPNWEMVLPKSLAFTAEISTDDFRRSLSRVTLTADDRNYSVTMEIEAGKLTLKSNNSEGEAQEEMLAAFSGGGQDGHSLRFNSRYLMDFLQVISKAGSQTFSFGFNDANSPFELFLPTEREGYRFVLMPLKGE
jgi:DNA polymerase-3 subunit beta